MRVTSIYPFPTMFSSLSKTEIIIYVTFNLSSAKVFNSDEDIFFLSSGNRLNPRHGKYSCRRLKVVIIDN